jgi:hypothetical protein
MVDFTITPEIVQRRLDHPPLKQYRASVNNRFLALKHIWLSLSTKQQQDTRQLKNAGLQAR